MDLSCEQAAAIIAHDRESHGRDLSLAIEGGDFPRWTLFIQMMTDAQVDVSQEVSDASTHGLQRSVAGRCEGARQRLRSHHAKRLPNALVDLVFPRVSQINGCAFCIDMHSRELLKEDITVEKLVLVPAWREGGALFDDTERAALAWAETVTRVAQTGVPDAEYKAAAAVFDRKQLADLTIAIGLMNAYNRVAISFRATPEAAKQQRLGTT